MTKKIFKIKHLPSGLFFKGRGMNANNQSHVFLDYKTQTLLDKNNAEHALKICFAKDGKNYNKKGHATSAVTNMSDKGLIDLLKDCVIIEYEIIEKELNIIPISKNG